MIGIKRSTGISGSLASTKIYVDNQLAAKIKENQRIDLELPNGEAKIYVSQFGNHSNELVVKDGQVLEITNSFWFYFNFIFLFTAMIFINIFIPFNYRIIGYILPLTLSIALSHFKNGFDLKVIYP
ncbi:MAG: hypothetical protein L0L39_03140 [Atopostipes suicloacalis]|nr:hypothetical protein [Atopostipes suicloacalis]